MFHPIDEWNVRPGNALDVDLKITLLQNIQSKYVLMKEVNYSCNNGKNDSDCEIYASIARMSSSGVWKNHGKTEN